MQVEWDVVDAYFDKLFVPRDEALDGALTRSVDAGMPQIHVAPNQGKLLYLLTKMHGTRRVLEIGTLAGYSTIWLGRAVGPQGKVVTLELDPKHADVARANFAHAGLTDVIELREGPALDLLAALAAENPPPFDFVFIDADKVSTTAYLEWAMKLTRVGSVIIVDNVVRKGHVIDDSSEDLSVIGTRKALDALSNDPRLEVTAIQTVGSKGWDGLALALRIG